MRNSEPVSGSGRSAARSAEDELDHLRRELLLRMAIQNATILAAVLSTTLFLLGLAVAPSGTAISVIGAVTTTGALVLQWCHCGVRIANIKAYIVRHADSADDGWETWLPSQRPRTLLGSRWLISTKGVFLGTQLVVLACGMAMGELGAPVAVLAILGIAASAAFLFTNPKE